METDGLFHLKVTWNGNIATLYYHVTLIHLPTATLHNELKQRFNLCNFSSLFVIGLHRPVPITESAWILTALV